MRPRDRQLQRIVHFIEEVKKDKYPNANTFAEKLKQMDFNYGTDLAVCPKTVKRDINYLKNGLGAPLEYDRSEHGYFMYMRDWTFPELALSGDELFAELFSRKISMQNALPSLKEHLETGFDIQMTAGDEKDVNIPALRSVIYATDKTVKVDQEVSQNILKGWKGCITLETSYAKDLNDVTHRKLDIHALFLSDKIWYCRAWCHSRKDYRNFALHKFSKAELTKDTFSRSVKVIKDLESGKIFNYKTLGRVTVNCSKKVAPYITDREWFAGQTNKKNEDDSWEVNFHNVPEQAVKSWIMSFAGDVTVVRPKKLKNDILKAAENIIKRHK